MGKEKRLHIYQRLPFRISFIILVIIFSGIGMTLYFYVQAQNTAILRSRVESVRDQMEILHISVKNSMLAGEAPIAVQLFRDFRRSGFVSEIMLYRADGVPAFSDNKTVGSVNTLLGAQLFKDKELFVGGSAAYEQPFLDAVSRVTDIEVAAPGSKNRIITIYSPLINQPKCASCHGLDHVVRGVIRVSSSLEKTYTMTERNTLITGAAGVAIIVFLSMAISVFINTTVIRRILRIGDVARLVGEGNFREKLPVSSNDEIGRLSDQFNSMIDGLSERFKLAKFVSKSTLDHVKDADEISLGGERTNVTVLFSDIRGFTAYSESRSPEEVMRVLNIVMKLQSSLIHANGGDIDKYVGDEIMAVFEGEEAPLRACRAALEIRDTMIRRQGEGEIDVSVGIGIHCGIVVSGNMGSEERIDRTIIGDTVNLGARLCSAAGNNTIIISNEVCQIVSGSVSVREQEPIRVKGKSEPVKIFTLRSIL